MSELWKHYFVFIALTEYKNLPRLQAPISVVFGTWTEETFIAMKQIELKYKKSNSAFYNRGIVAVYKSCAPFVENKMAGLIHRPITVLLHKGCRKYHFSFQYACGLSATGSDKFTMLDDLNESHVVCHRCETMAVKMGYEPSSTICRKHVHIGSTKVVKNCCND